MKKQHVIVFLIALYASVGLATDISTKDKKVIVKKEVKKNKIKKQKLVQKKQEVTPFQLAQNISTIINFLIRHKDEMTDVEPLLIKRRDATIDLCKAEGYCILKMANACFATREGEDILALINWSNIHPFLDKDMYSDGLKKAINLNIKYNTDSYYKASQSEVARDKLREIIHENIFSIIDAINKIHVYIPKFYYSGHPYEGISPLDHVALYNVLSGEKNNLSSLDTCYHKWQVALYRNLFLLLKLIAEKVKEAGIDNDDDNEILTDISKREVGDDAVALPSGMCAPHKKLLEKTTKSNAVDNAPEGAVVEVE